MFKKIPVVFLLAAAIVMLTALPAFAAPLTFTKQPKGGEVDLGQTFTFTFETNVPASYVMLQSRGDETEDWGNMETVTSPHTLSEYSFPYSAQFRLMANDGENDYYSDVFTVKWKEADNATTARLDEIDWAEDLPLGYSELTAVPFKVTNTGSFPLKNPKITLPEGSLLELFQDKKVDSIAPGETNATAWRVRPKKGVGIGSYRELLYITADNLKGDVEGGVVVFFVVESDVELTYKLEADPIDFGKVAWNYDLTASIPLVLRSTGTGNLTKVHLKLEDSDQSFYVMHSNNGSLDTMNAGTDSGGNWYVTLREAAPAGAHDTVIKAYAKELKEPLLIHIKADIEAAPVESQISEGDGETPADTENTNDGSEPIQTAADGDTDKKSGSFPWLAVVIPAVVVIAGVVAVIFIKNKNKQS